MMAYLYLDDSKHHRFGFSLAAFVISDSDPSNELTSLYLQHGYDPTSFEFKSYARMDGDPRLRRLRSALKRFIARNCKIALCIAKDDKSLGPTSLELLKHALDHPRLSESEHEVYFDQGLFTSQKQAQDLVIFKGFDDRCRLNFEQDSRKVLGIQLADIVAHTCATMLLEQLGHVQKFVTLNVPGDEIYDGLDVELGFEMWADLRYCFLSQNKKDPKDNFELALVDTYPWGLHIDENVDDGIRLATMNRFREIY